MHANNQARLKKNIFLFNYLELNKKQNFRYLKTHERGVSDVDAYCKK
jgi:hypothetical protein